MATKPPAELWPVEKLWVYVWINSSWHCIVNFRENEIPRLIFSVYDDLNQTHGEYPDKPQEPINQELHSTELLPNLAIIQQFHHPIRYQTKTLGTTSVTVWSLFGGQGSPIFNNEVISFCNKENSFQWWLWTQCRWSTAEYSCTSMQTCEWQSKNQTAYKVQPIRNPIIWDWTDVQFPILLRIKFKAMFSLAYYGLLRIGELTLSQHALRAKNISIAVNKQKLLLVLYSSKTHGKESCLQQIKISGMGEKCNVTNNVRFCHRVFCLFMITRRYMSLRGNYLNDTEQFFIFRDRSPVQPGQVQSVLKQLLTSINLDCSVYNFQSFRIGRCSELITLGYSIEQVKKLGRWRSNAVYKYIKDWNLTKLQPKEMCNQRIVWIIYQSIDIYVFYDIFAGKIKAIKTSCLVGNDFCNRSYTTYFKQLQSQTE